MRGLAFLPAVIAGYVQRADIWKRHIKGEVGSCVEPLVARVMDGAVRARVLNHRWNRPVVECKVRTGVAQLTVSAIRFAHKQGVRKVQPLGLEKVWERNPKHGLVTPPGCVPKELT